LTIPRGLGPFLRLQIGAGDNKVDIGDGLVQLVWSSFINSGYSVEATVTDNYYERLRQIAVNDYLSEARFNPVPITFSISWASDKADLSTPKITAYITNLSALGESSSGELNFMAIDPPSFVLSHGDSFGGAYKGNISSVLKQVVEKYSKIAFQHTKQDPKPKIVVEVSETKDNKDGIWYQMRQDPRTFINSLLEWSSSLTKNKTNWVIASGETIVEANDRKVAQPKLVIKEWSDLPNFDYSDPGNGFGHGPIDINTAGADGGNDINFVELLSDNHIGILQSKLTTSGLSAVNGKYIDPNKISKAVVDDSTTANKVKPSGLSQERAFKKPESEKPRLSQSTTVPPVPELNGGEMGVDYEDWIDGRARGLFLGMLNSVMRIKVNVSGWHVIGDSTLLGASTVNLSWIGIDGNPYFLSGRWLLYGFRHIVTTDDWQTELYLARIDWDALARKEI